jgi:hypothetical protein
MTGTARRFDFEFGVEDRCHPSAKKGVADPAVWANGPGIIGVERDSWQSGCDRPSGSASAWELLAASPISPTRDEVVALRSQRAIILGVTEAIVYFRFRRGR